MNNKGIKVCMISCTHGLQDDRIYWKEALSLAKEGFQVSHIAVGDEDKNYVTDEGITLIQIKRIASYGFKRFQTYKKILEAAANQKAAVYHLHDWQLNIIVSSLQKLNWKPKVVYDAHESTRLLLEQDIADRQLTFLQKAYYSIKARQAGKWEKRKAANYDAIIAAEEYVLSTFDENPAQLKEVIHNYSFFDVETSPSSTVKEFDVVYAGLLARNRGIAELIESIAICKKERPAIKTLLIGSFHDNDFANEVKSKIRKLQIEGNIILHDAVPYTDVKKYLQKGKIGICTWLLTGKNKQAIPIKLFEYMALGLPVVFSKGCYASKYINESNCGILVNPSQPEAVAKSILGLLNNKDTFEKYVANGYKAIQQQYNWKQESLKLLKVYQALLNLH